MNSEPGQNWQMNWKQIAQHFANRTNVQCYQRWHRTLKPGLVKGGWTAREDQLLTSTMYARLSSGVSADIDWPLIAQSLCGRSTKQCRERWTCVLDPSLKKSGWSEEEDQLLLTFHAQMGNRWASIAKMLPGRTQLHVRDRWRCLEKKTSSHATLALPLPSPGVNASLFAAASMVSQSLDARSMKMVVEVVQPANAISTGAPARQPAKQTQHGTQQSVTQHGTQQSVTTTATALGVLAEAVALTCQPSSSSDTLVQL
jgi:hypothetical protein